MMRENLSEESKIYVSSIGKSLRKRPETKPFEEDSSESDSGSEAVQKLAPPARSFPPVITLPISRVFSSPSGMRKSNLKLKYVCCVPMDSQIPLPVPSPYWKEKLQKHGLRVQVDFTMDVSPARIRENISKAFSKTFSLRSQELLQFDYLTPTSDSKLLEKAEKLHFGTEVLFSLAVGDDIFVQLRQPTPNPDINWSKLLQQSGDVETLGDEEYKDLMLSLMYRLSKGKHQKDSTPQQQEMIEGMIKDYKLNSYLQLVHTGNGIDQLVLFTAKRREEAFEKAHLPNHCDAEETYEKIYNQFMWQDMKTWIVDKVEKCVGCDASSSKSVRDAKKRKSKVEKSTPMKKPKGEVIPLVETDENEMIVKIEQEEESERQISANTFCTETMQSLYDYQKQGLFCDFNIILLPSVANGIEDPREFAVHRVVLAVASSRIRKLPKSSIKICGKITPESLDAVIEYAYTGKIVNVRNLTSQAITEINNTALVLDIGIDGYLEHERPNFTRTSVKVLVAKGDRK